MSNGFVRALIYGGGTLVFIVMIYGHGGHADGHASVTPSHDSGPVHSSLPKHVSDGHSFSMHLQDFWETQEVPEEKTYRFTGRELVLTFTVGHPEADSFKTFMKEVNTQQATGYEGKASVTVLKQEEASIGGQPAVMRHETWNAAGFDALAAYTFKDGYSFTFTLYREDGATPRAEDEKIFEEIVKGVELE